MVRYVGKSGDLDLGLTPVTRGVIIVVEWRFPSHEISGIAREYVRILRLKF